MKKIVIADTILTILDRSNSLLRRGGIEIFAAKTAEEILDLHRQKNADIIIVDFTFPAMGGAKLCAAVRNDASLKGTSIILACDKVHRDLPLCRNAGANAVIEKPVDPVDLYLKVSELIAIPQRRDIRVLLRVAVSSGAAGAPSFASSENISISGMLIETNLKMAPGDQVDCSFFIGHNEIKVQSRVMRVELAASGRYRCGVRFLNPDTKSMIVIEQYVKSRSRG